MRNATLVVSTAALAMTIGIAQAAKPEACPAGRFLVSGTPIITGAATPPTDAVVVGASQIGISSGCPLTGAKVRAKKKFTQANAKWPTCGSLTKVSLTARIASPDCNNLSGTLKAKKSKPIRFTAVRSRCGDGIYDAEGEPCDAGQGCGTDAQCTTACVCEPVAPSTTGTTTSSTSSTSSSTTSTASTSTTTTTISPVCGNGTTDTGETCDDGNNSDNDSCPANCVIEACTPVASASVPISVRFATPPRTNVAGMSVLLNYPEGRAIVPGSGNQIPAGTVVNTPSGAFTTSNDLDHALRVVIAGATSIRPGLLFGVNLQGCQGAAPPSAGDFVCTVLSAFAPDGVTPVAGVTCSVAVP